MKTPANQASEDEIESQVVRITGVMRPPAGMDAARLLDGYVAALKGFPLRAITDAVDGFLSGRFAAAFSPKWCPMPPEMASMVRSCLDSAGPARGRLYGYRRPRSAVLKDSVTRDFARTLSDQRVVSAGCIWVPGEWNPDKPGSQRFGTLFAPDPDWQPAVPLGRSGGDDLEQEPSGADELSEADRARINRIRSSETASGGPRDG